MESKAKGLLHSFLIVIGSIVVWQLLKGIFPTQVQNIVGI
jgi:hypothetical protein